MAKLNEKIYKISNKLFNELKDNNSKNEYYWKITNDDFSKLFPDGIPENPLNPKEYVLPQSKTSLEETLTPLDTVFIDDQLKDDIVTRTAVPELLQGSEPGYSGVILYGPPGTGKTVLLRALSQVYQNAGAYSKEVSAANTNSKWVGEFAKNLETEIKTALKQADKTKKPSLLVFDEGSIMAQKASEGAESVAKHYQEAMDVLKRYVGNDRRLVLAISTNLLPESFEDALTREGRLTSYFIGYPDTEQRKKMWSYFTKLNKITDLSEEQAEQLAQGTEAEQGAFIEEFCRTYLSSRRTALLRQKGHKTLVASLKKGARISEAEVSASITYDALYQDALEALEKKYERNGNSNGKKDPIGFKTN